MPPDRPKRREGRRPWRYEPNPNRHSILRPDTSAAPQQGSGASPSRSPRDFSPSTFLEHEPCPKCGSEDNLARYDDGHAWCFTPGCGHYEPPGASLAPARATATRRHALPLLAGEAQPLPARHLDLETCRRFQYWVGRLEDATRVEIANYHDAHGAAVAQKVRAPGKRFHWRGCPREAALFGQRLWRRGPRKQLVVAEGELDAMSVAQALSLRWPVVSVPNGAASARSALAKQLEWLREFETIVLLFDQDEAGRGAARESAALFPEKARIAWLPLKDASKMLTGGRAGELVKAIWSASALEDIR